jgi:hypothetical protein
LERVLESTQDELLAQKRGTLVSLFTARVLKKKKERMMKGMKRGRPRSCYLPSSEEGNVSLC